MRKRTKTYNALMISMVLHIVLMMVSSFYLAITPETFDDALSIVLLSEEHVPEPKIRKPYLLPQIAPPTPRARSTVARAGQAPRYAVTFSDLTPVALIQENHVLSPKAPVQSDAVPDLVTHSDIPLTPHPAVPDTSSGEASHATSPSTSGVRRGSGAAGQGIGKIRHRSSELSKRFAELPTDLDAIDKSPLTEPVDMPQGLGIFETKVMPGHGLLGGVYVPGGPIYTMPDFDSLTPIYTFLTAKLDIPEREYTAGFPTPNNLHIIENFAIRFRGQLYIDSTGRYHFALNADDGAQLYIDGLLVVNNDGIHPTTYRRGSIALTMGLHLVEIRYFQGPRFHIALEWFYTPPGQRERIVPPEMLSRPGHPRATRSQKT